MAYMTATQTIRATFDILDDVKRGLDDSTTRQFLSVVFDEDEDNSVVSLRLVQQNGDRWRETIVRDMPMTSVRPSQPTPILDGTDPDPRIVIVYEWLVKTFPELKTYEEFSNDDLKRIFYGLVQQGKSRLLLAIVWILWYKFRKQVCIILMEMTDSLNQFMTRDVVSFNLQPELLGLTLDIDSVLHMYKHMKGSSVRTMESAPILVGLANNSQLTKMNVIL